MKKTCLLLILVVLLSACNNGSSIKERFINDDSYWALYDEAQPGFYSIYYKFNSDGKSDRYYQNDKVLTLANGSDVDESDVPWSITKDSILQWGSNRFHIINCNDNVIVLYSAGGLRRHFFLIKEYPGKLRRGKVYYEELDSGHSQIR